MSRKMNELSVTIVPASAKPLIYDEEKCIGCNKCVNVCQVDLLFPNPQGGVPIVMYPGECYYCGSCVMACPEKAVTLQHPLMNRAKFVPVK